MAFLKDSCHACFSLLVFLQDVIPMVIMIVKNTLYIGMTAVVYIGTYLFWFVTYVVNLALTPFVVLGFFVLWVVEVIYDVMNTNIYHFEEIRQGCMAESGSVARAECITVAVNAMLSNHAPVGVLACVVIVTIVGLKQSWVGFGVFRVVYASGRLVVKTLLFSAMLLVDIVQSSRGDPTHLLYYECPLIWASIWVEFNNSVFEGSADTTPQPTTPQPTTPQPTTPQPTTNGHLTVTG